MDLRDTLRAATWSGGSAVWGQNVVISADEDLRALLSSLRSPCIAIRPGSGAHDEEFRQEPAQVAIDVGFRLVASVSGDPVGENAIIGSGRVSETTSGGKGLLELQERLFDSIRLLQENNGIIMQLVAQDVVSAVQLDEMSYVSWRDYIFRAQISVAKFFPPARSFLAVDAAGGDATLTWKVPAARFDRYRPIMRRAAGATPPASSTAGSDVVLATGMPTSHTDSPGAGQFSYALFMAYDDRDTPPDSDKDVSTSITATVTVNT